MKKNIIAFFTLMLSYTAYGQQADSVLATSDYKAQIEVLNHQFPDLKRNASLGELENRYKITLNTIGGCLMILEYAEVLRLDSSGKTALKKRLEEVADTYGTEGSPILLSGNGMNSVENAISNNSQPNDYNIKYVSTGNSCISELGSWAYFGIAAFNRSTLDKLGLKCAPGVEGSQKNLTKRKKKNAA
jgi:hypothetical protein